MQQWWFSGSIAATPRNQTSFDPAAQLRDITFSSPAALIPMMQEAMF
jgi:hypothetical protein